MLVPSKKYYIITYYQTFYKARFIDASLCDKINLTFYRFRTKAGDLFLYQKNEDYKSFITEDFEELKMEIAQMMFRGKHVQRSPVNNEKVLKYYLKRFPEKFV